MLIKRKYLFGTTILAGVVAVAAPAFAQSQLPSVTVQGQRDQDAVQIEEVVVTGSRIRRDPTNTPTPIISVSRDDLINTGQNSVIDYLATIPALSNSRVPSDTVDVFSQGVGLLGIAAPNLRSLGAGRTLTLIDGKRQVGSVGGSLQVDIDTIPRLLIENIEIVTGGASSVYGADAVSGVLNFVLRKDFEGLEVDLNAAQINQGGQASYRASVLGGVNLLDDRLNLWGFAEYEHVDPIKSLDLDWMEDSYGLVAIDADPAAAPNDGNIDSALFSGLRTLGRLPWGQTTLANSQPGSELNNPLIPHAPCNLSLGSASGYTSANCYAVNPGKTFIYDGPTARLANFGQRIGNTGLSRTLNIGGDGFNPNGLTFEDRTPEQTSQRYAAGANFALTSNVMLSVEAKYVTEDSFANSQAVFFDVLLNNERNAAGSLNRWWVDTQTPGYNTFDLRYTDNAFLPQNVKDAITANQIQNYNAPTATTPGTPNGALAPAPYARHSLFGPQRGQDQNRELQRYMVSLTGDFDQLLFVKNINWEASYVYGELNNVSIEDSVDVERFRLAADAIRDTGGVVNGVVNQIVCRSQVILKNGGALPDSIRGGDMRNNPFGLAAVNDCKPLNIFGAGNQSAEGLAYVRDGSLQTVRERNEQEQAIAVVSGELWDFTGAGPIGIAVGAEYRREYTDASGRAEQDDLFLFGLQGPDFPGAEYESEEAFAELSIPLFRDSWLGEYAELSGSYRYFDYTTAGTGDVYGVNLVYRPIRDIGFKTSYNTSFRAPNLGENFSPLSQTFSNGWVDPCTTANIIAPGTTAEVRANRIQNCEALAVQRGYTAGFFDFAGATPTTQDDYVQNSTSIVGLSGGNIALQPETSESFTFTTVLEPRFFPNFSLVLDYYEIRIDNVISAVTVNQAAALCVDTAALGPACSTIFRNSPFQAGNTNVERSAGFQLGGASGSDPGFIQTSVNFAAAQTRGLDFTANYSIDTEELLGRNWGRLNYSLRGNWLIEQKQFNNPALPGAFTEFASNPGSPRVRFTSSLTWAPTDALSINWTADWQTGQDNTRTRDIVAAGNFDNRLYEYYSTGDFTRHDFTVRYQVNDQVSVRTGVTNAFDAEQPRFLGGTLQDNYDPYGTRFFVGLNYRPW